MNCTKCDGQLIITETDSRQEWCEEMMQCDKCDKTFVHRTEFNQNGLVTLDEVTEE